MKREDLVNKIKHLEKESDKSENENYSNRCMNERSVLVFMLETWNISIRNNTGEKYDEDTDFNVAYANAIEEMIELDQQSIITTDGLLRLSRGEVKRLTVENSKQAIVILRLIDEKKALTVALNKVYNPKRLHKRPHHNRFHPNNSR